MRHDGDEERKAARTEGIGLPSGEIMKGFRPHFRYKYQEIFEVPGKKTKTKRKYLW